MTVMVLQVFHSDKNSGRTFFLKSCCASMRFKAVSVIALLLFLTGIFVYAIHYFSSKPAQLTGAKTLNVFYQHKTIPKVVEPEVVKALSFYPELKDTPIDFVFDPNTSKSIMLSQPVLKSFFRGQNNRTYIIKINPRFVMTHRFMPIQNVPQDILVGWFGHELGHVMDYSRRSNWQMLLFGVEYLCSDHFLMQAERNADTYAVNHGLGTYILATKNFILNNGDLPLAYKERIKRLYLSPQQIMDLIKKIKKPI